MARATPIWYIPGKKSSSAPLVAHWRKLEFLVVRYDWFRAGKPKLPKNHKELTAEEIELFKSQSLAKNDNSYIELYTVNGENVGIYHYVYGADGSYYEWGCGWRIKDGILEIAPYYYLDLKIPTKEIYEIQGENLKYIGSLDPRKSDKPKRDLPFSMYINYTKNYNPPTPYSGPQQFPVSDGANKILVIPPSGEVPPGIVVPIDAGHAQRTTDAQRAAGMHKPQQHVNAGQNTNAKEQAPKKRGFLGRIFFGDKH